MNEREHIQNNIELLMLEIQGLQLLETKVLQQRTLVDIKRTKQAEDEPLIEYYTITVYKIQKQIRAKKEQIKRYIQ